MVCFSLLNGHLQFTIEYTPNWVYHATSLPSCNHIKFTKVHPTFQKNCEKHPKNLKHISQSSLRKHDFLAFFCIFQISWKFSQITLLQRRRKLKNDTSELSEFFFRKKFPPSIFFARSFRVILPNNKKVASGDNIFFCDNTFFSNFQFSKWNPAKKNVITFLRMLSLLKLKCKACYQHKTMLSIPKLNFKH